MERLFRDATLSGTRVESPWLLLCLLSMRAALCPGLGSVCPNLSCPFGRWAGYPGRILESCDTEKGTDHIQDEAQRVL